MIELKIGRPITVMMDNLILEQLSKKVRDQLGAVVETGYHLGYNRRDYFFEHGSAQYKLGSNTIAVTID